MKIWYFRIFMVVFCLFAASDLTAQDPNRKKAEEMIKASVKLTKTGLYPKSIEILDEAYKISPLPIIFWNKARNYEFMKDYKNALKWFEEFGKVNDGKSIKQGKVAVKIDEMKKIVPPEISVNGKPEKASFSIDDKPSGETPAVDFQVGTGEHVLKITHPDYKPKVFSFSINMAEHRDFSYELEKNFGKVLLQGEKEEIVVLMTDDGKETAVTVPGEMSLDYGSHKIYIKESKIYESTYYEFKVGEQAANIKLKVLPPPPPPPPPAPVTVETKPEPVKPDANKGKDSYEVKVEYKTNFQKWVTMGGGGLLILGGGYCLLTSYQKWNSVKDAKTDKNGVTTNMTQNSASNEITVAKIYYFAGYGLIGIGTLSVVWSLFMDSKTPVVKNAGVFPTENGAMAVYSLSW
jgi:hypothetical protein